MAGFELIVPEQHKKPSSTKTYSYGTAGFREAATDLPFVMFRCGIVAVLRSCKKKAIGIMITASHNPEKDNGVKLIDPMGEMLEAAWEAYATEIVNCTDDKLAEVVKRICKETEIEEFGAANVFVAYDLRKSSPSLRDAVIAGVQMLGGHYQDFGLLTTPQLHFIVRAHNSCGLYGIPTEDGYYKKICTAFLNLNKNKQFSEYSATVGYSPQITVDCANGVGALKLRKLLTTLKELSPHNNFIDVRFCNAAEGILNYKCGADHVKISKSPPMGLAVSPYEKWASYDGDADRIVYYFKDADFHFHLLDGDKISALFSLYIQKLLKDANITASIGVVQTAYANGNSTQYIEDVLKLPVFCVPTGVKHLHKKAEEFDIGVYFEANGHGTAIFSESFKGRLKDCQRNDATDKFLSFIDLLNETVGDALSDMLAVETVLRDCSLSILDWDKLYTDVPCRQLKIKVKDRSIFETTDADRKCTKPEGLQDKIDEHVSKFTCGRSFVRPSGTEDIVRIYAEADTQENANELAALVAGTVFDMAGGIGERVTFERLIVPHETEFNIKLSYQ